MLVDVKLIEWLPLPFESYMYELSVSLRPSIVRNGRGISDVVGPGQRRLHMRSSIAVEARKHGAVCGPRRVVQGCPRLLSTG